uniref:Uncharacterized protein n=1 Tax=Globodera pallida TaxID=36090 RepID=A0A183CFU1_GLOPA
MFELRNVGRSAPVPVAPRGGHNGAWVGVPLPAAPGGDESGPSTSNHVNDENAESGIIEQRQQQQREKQQHQPAEEVGNQQQPEVEMREQAGPNLQLRGHERRVRLNCVRLNVFKVERPRPSWCRLRGCSERTNASSAVRISKL